MENIQIKFRKELDQFINDKKEQQRKFQTMAIIYCQYPFQTEMKISFFGLKNQVDIAKKQIKMLINKHQMRTIRIGLDPKQVKMPRLANWQAFGRDESPIGELQYPK